METINKIGKYGFIAEPFRCDFNAALFLSNLGNILLNAADFHSTERGYGMQTLNKINKTWVLSRLVIDIFDMPKMYEHFEVETWIESVIKLFTNRNFKISNKEGKIYGYGKTIWAMIDTASREPVDLLNLNNGLITQYIENDYDCPIDKPSRVAISKIAPLATTIQTHYHDGDINGHINSIKYIEHILNLWDSSWYKEHQIKRIEVAYVAESYIGDFLDIYMDKEEGEDSKHDFRIKINKRNSTSEAVEVCRARIIFR